MFLPLFFVGIGALLAVMLAAVMASE